MNRAEKITLDICLYLALVLVLDLGDQTVQLGAHGVGCGSTAGTLEVLLGKVTNSKVHLSASSLLCLFATNIREVLRCSNMIQSTLCSRVRYQGGEGVRVVVLLLGTGSWLEGSHCWRGVNVLRWDVWGVMNE